MTYEQTLEFIYSIKPFAPKASLSRIKKLLNLMGNPQEKLKVVHVAGTNGKGTCSNYISKVLSEAGYKTGLYTSPFIIDFRERFQINSEMINKEELVLQASYVKNFVNEVEDLTQFEFITALALNWFAKSACDVVVLEVGLGGRYDATNACENVLLSVIMSISLDHTQVLGNTVGEIAFEKAGIIKKSTDVVLYPNQEEETFKIVKEVANEMNSSIIIPNLNYRVVKESLAGSELIYDDFFLEIPFSAKHQQINACTAFEAVKALKNKGLNIEDEHVINGFKNMKILARTEVLRENLPIILDGSHNEGGAKALKALVEKELVNMPVCGVIAMVKDKDYENCIKIFAECFDEIKCVKMNAFRALEPEDLEKVSKKYCASTKSIAKLEEAVEQIINYKGAVVVCGSLYLAGEIRPLLIKALENKK